MPGPQYTMAAGKDYYQETGKTSLMGTTLPESLVCFYTASLLLFPFSVLTPLFSISYVSIALEVSHILSLYFQF